MSKLPETFKLDGQRLRKIRDALQDIVAVTVMLLVTKEFTKHRLSSARAGQLHGELLILLADKECGIQHFTSAIEAEVQTIRGTLKDEERRLLRSVLDKNLTITSPMSQLLLSRLSDHIRVYLMGQRLPDSESLSRHGLNESGELVAETIKQVHCVFAHNKRVFGKHYQVILTQIETNSLAF